MNVNPISEMELMEYSVPEVEDIVGLFKSQNTVTLFNGKPFLLPKLHYLLYRIDDPILSNQYECVCLELGLFSVGKKEKDAVLNVIDQSIAFMTDIIENESQDRLITLLQDNGMESFWAKARIYSMSESVSNRIDSEFALLYQLQKQSETLEEQKKINELLLTQINILKDELISFEQKFHLISGGPISFSFFSEMKNNR